MSSTYLCVVIDREDGTLSAWNGLQESTPEFKLGDRVEMVIGKDVEELADSDEPMVAPTEVVHMSNTEDGEDYAILYTHEFDLTPEMENILESTGWEPADNEMLGDIARILDDTAIVATTHHVVLVVGDYSEPEQMRLWTRVLEPENPMLPFFGERFYTQLFFSEIPEGQFSKSAQFAPDAKAGSSLYVDEVVDINAPGDIDKGFPVLIFQAGKVDYGHAQISMYVNALEPYDEYSLVADGWEPISRDELDPVTERIPERIDLAKRTRIKLHKPESFDESDAMEVSDYEIESPETITEEQYELLPGYLISHIELQKEIESIPDELQAWVDNSQSNGDEETKK